MPWSEVLSGLTGAFAALAGRALIVRWRQTSEAQGLAIALWEELQAVEFSDLGTGMVFAGFSSQVFDTLFADIAHLFPEGLARDVMRYHWRMKYLEETKESPWRGWHEMAEEARNQHEALSADLDAYGEAIRLGLFVNRNWY